VLSLLVGWLTLFGLAGLVPGLDGSDRHGWLGARMFAALGLLVVTIFILQIALGVALAPSAWVVCAMAGAGWIRHGRACLPLSHPILLLPLAAAAVAALQGGIFYEPLAWDELSNWLGWMRQAVATGHLDSPQIDNAVLGYPPGWPIILAFPNLVLGGIDDSRSTALFLLFHVAVLGLVHDVVGARLAATGWPPLSARLGAWCVLLAALAAEATWKLVPTNLLVEEPQTYTLAACVFLTIAAAPNKVSPKVGPGRAGLHLGLAFALGYLIKVSMLAFALPLMLLAAGLRVRPTLMALVGFAVPVIAVYGIWTAMGAPQGCISNPLAVAKGLIGGGASGDRAADLWHRFAAAEIAYVQSYKLPLTVLAGLGLASALASRRLAAVPVALASYVVLYFGALYVYHLDCFGEYYFNELNSIDRFTRVPLRLIHLCGLVVPVLVAAPFLARRASGRAAVAGMVAVIMVLGLWQIRQIHASFASMASRWDASAEQVGTVRAIRHDSEIIAQVTDAQPVLGRNVVQIAQGGDGYDFVIGRYYGLGHFKLAGSWSWGTAPVNLWMRGVPAHDMPGILLSASLVWPVRTDAWMMAVLRDLIRDPDCLAHPTEHLFIPQPDSGTLRCLDGIRLHPRDQG
jgi:hypothetical protein